MDVMIKNKDPIRTWLTLQNMFQTYYEHKFYLCQTKCTNESLWGTLNIKFGIYTCQTTILKGGVLDNSPTYFFITQLLSNFLIYTY
jgi:hypothetical protein